MRFEFWIASHLDSEQRLEHFEAQLRSIAAQSRIPDFVRVSYSIDDGVGRSVTGRLAVALGFLSHSIVTNNRRLTQFEHLAAIARMAHVSQNDDTWVALCDDEVLCAVDRLRIVEAALIGSVEKKKRAKPLDVLYCAFVRGPMPEPSVDFDELVRRAQTNQRALDQKRADPFKFIGTTGLHIVQMGEHGSMHVRACLLREFLAVQTHVHSLSDCSFRAWLGREAKHEYIDDVLYYHRVWSDQNAWSALNLVEHRDRRRVDFSDLAV